MKQVVSALLLLSLFFVFCKKQKNKVTRADTAVKITNTYPRSCQNPVFSPDGEYIVYTRFLNGYNIGPSELVKIKRDGRKEEIIVSAANSSNVNVPFGSWVGNKICFSSDRAGGADEIWVVNDDGSELRQLTQHDASTGIYYTEPVFNPQNSNQVLFEYVTGENDFTAIHQIAFLDASDGNIRLLTDAGWDDRLPSWSNDGSKILFQRNKYGQDEGWMIYIAEIDIGNPTPLSNLRAISKGTSDDTDCSWGYNDSFLITSSNYGRLNAPNIFMLPTDTMQVPVRVTFNQLYQEGAPSQSHDGKWIAFESHFGESEDQASALWVIATK